MVKRIALVAIVVTGCVALATPAIAAPVNAPGAEVITLVCDNGRTYDIVVAPGNGEWTPGIIINGRGAVVPFGFENFRGELRDADGNLVDEYIGTDSYKPSAKRHNLVRCDFSQSFEEDGLTGTFSGTVLVKVAGRR